MQMRHYALQAEKQDQAQRGDTALRNAIQQFTKDDGTIIPFNIKEKYDITREKRSESWVDFVSGC
jgi:hypothetical protein